MKIAPLSGTLMTPEFLTPSFVCSHVSPLSLPMPDVVSSFRLTRLGYKPAMVRRSFPVSASDGSSGALFFRSLGRRGTAHAAGRLLPFSPPGAAQCRGACLDAVMARSCREGGVERVGRPRAHAPGSQSRHESRQTRAGRERRRNEHRDSFGIQWMRHCRSQDRALVRNSVL